MSHLGPRRRRGQRGAVTAELALGKTSGKTGPIVARTIAVTTTPDAPANPSETHD